MQTTQNGVSVIIPVYNREKYLEECINSVKSQQCDFLQGPNTTRNRGIKAATYPILAFLDSNDYFLPNHLQRC
jgi:glycosyltransferase involved in cell wall biosynthesis